MRFLALNRSFAMLAVALFAGLCAAWSAQRYLQSRARQIEDRAKVPKVGRGVAAYDLPAGTRLSSEHVAVRQYPASAVSSTSLSPRRFSELDNSVKNGRAAVREKGW